MEAHSVIYGLSDSIVDQSSTVFSRYPQNQRVFNYGSRAKGDFKNYSDLDLAVDAAGMNRREFSRLWNDIDELPSVFKYDLVNLQAVPNERLLKNIRRHGLVFYPNAAGAFINTENNT